MRVKKTKSRVISFVLVLAMLVGILPSNIFASDETVSTVAESDDTLTAALEEAKNYIDTLTINNSINDPSTVVSTWGSEFTWDNEKRESKNESDLYDWSYYNGVVFEGLEYVYEVTEDSNYKDYVVEYMSSLIAANGTWAKCSNNSSKKCAGYDSTHGADCYKTASLLLDAYEMTKDSRYLTMAATLYADLDTAAESYLLADAGNNYRHTWATDPDPDLWLDGLYMILPFRAEYAKYVGDTEELNLIVSRLQWVSDNMYNSEKGLFYHAADSASSNSGTYWLRSIGWYAAAIVDVMDSMEGDNLETMKTQLVKLVDGMKATQNEDNGMWLNNLVASQSSTNPYETSGTALVCYAVMKAVNNGWLDSSYADMAILAFEGICEEKLSNNNLTDICFKGAPGSSNSTFYDNEGKGVGPFIMLYAEVLEYTKKNTSDDSSSEDDNTTENVVVTKTDEETGVSVAATGITGLTVAKIEDTTDIATKVEGVLTGNLVAYNITVEGFTTGSTATVTVPVPDGVDVNNFAVYYVSDSGELEKMEGAPASETTYEFKTTHFSTYVGGEVATAAEDDGSGDEGNSDNEDTTVTDVRGTGNLVGGTVYTLDTDGVDKDSTYLIVNTSSDTKNGSALTNNSGSTTVSISDGKIIVEDDSNIAWSFSSASSGTIKNGSYYYVYLGNNAVLSTTDNRTLTISNKRSGAYQIYYTSKNKKTYYLYCNNNTWSRSTSASTVYLYKKTGTSTGEAVTFTLTPSSVTLAPEATQVLTGTVTVAGETVDLSNCTITWASSNESVATLSDGTVTGVTDGPADITATLRAVNGTALQKNIVLTIPVTVKSKTIESATLTGNTPVTTKQNVEPDFSNIKLEVTYDDDTTGTITVDNGLVIEGYDITTIGYSYATISYAGKQYGTVRVTVDGNPYEGLEDATEYPEYPADGAVRIDKTATANAQDFKNTGVTHVELNVAGISVKKGVNVLLVMDISNSMSWNDSDYSYEDEDVTEGTTQRLNISKAAAKAFVNELLQENEDGSKTLNKVSILAFAGIDGDYNTHSTATANDDVYQLGELAMDDISEAEAAIDSLVKATTGGTNYDYAFQQAYDMAEKLYVENGQEVHIVFMTDGVPTHYNGVYYKNRNSTDLTACMQYVDPTTGKTSYYTSTGYDRSGNDIDAIATQSITVYYNDGTTETKTVTYNKGWADYVTGNLNGWAEKVKDLDYVAKVYSIGFGMKNGSVTQGATSGMPTLSDVNGGQYYVPYSVTKTLLENVASTVDDYYEAENEEELSSLYKSLATQIRHAGTSANVTDIIDDEFTLQMAATSGSGEKTATLSNFGITPQITVTTYDLYTKEETPDATLIGTRKGTFEVLETVTFNDAGTKAYSNLIDDGKTNIMSTDTDGTVTIEAHYFTYTKTPEGVETFKWEIGNITDKEIALGFYVYLKESLEGGAEEGIYYTNEKATLEYIDINGKHATQIFPIPSIGWGGASTTIRFYLVNENGEPVNRNGDVIPFANRIYVGEPVTVTLNLNADATIDAQTIEAAAYVPSKYYLYDIYASYTVQTASGDENSIIGGITCSEPSSDAYKTAGGKTQNGAQTTIVITHEAIYYTYSTVGFGVRWDLSKEETDEPLIAEKVVIDYGKAIDVDVLSNDPVIEGYNRTLTGFVLFSSNINPKVKQLNAGAEKYTSNNGSYSIVDQKVRFQLTKMLSEVERVFYVVKYASETNTEDYYYLFGELDIIPATTVYYETNFADGIFDVTTTGSVWSTKTDSDETTSTVVDGDDEVQNDGTIGVGQIYGYDSTYTDDAYLSNGSSLFVEGQGVKLNDSTTNYTEAKFSFTGTGFDLISRTGTDQGAIRVSIYNDADRTNLKKSVTVLNKSESNLELYQIPVVSVNDLEYGTYYVTIGVNAAYTNKNYPALNRGGEFYFDAIRIFDPAKGNAEAEEAYASDGELNPIITEVRAELLEQESFDALANDEQTAGIVFVDRKEGDTHDWAEVSTYATIGPDNEVYLSKGQGIAFLIDNVNNVPVSVDIGAKTISGASAIMKAIVISSNDKDAFIENDENFAYITQPIATATSMYYDLMCGSVLENSAYVVIQNTGDGVLSITDLKIAYGVDSTDIATVSLLVDEDTFAVASTFMLSRSNEDVETEEPETEETLPEETETETESEVDTEESESETEIEESESESETEAPEVVSPNYDIISASFDSSSCRLWRTATMTVVTSQDVANVTVSNRYYSVKSSAITYEDMEDGSRVWTVSITSYLYGNQSYTVTGYGEDGTAGTSATASIKVTLF